MFSIAYSSLLWARSPSFWRKARSRNFRGVSRKTFWCARQGRGEEFLVARESRLAQRAPGRPHRACADLRLSLGALSQTWRLWEMRLSHCPVDKGRDLLINRQQKISVHKQTMPHMHQGRLFLHKPRAIRRKVGVTLG